MKKIYFSVLSILTLLACEKQKSEGIIKGSPMNSRYVKLYNDKDKISQLHQRILQKGDTVAYMELKAIYDISEHYDELLYVSTVMAEKYNYREAYKTSYEILVRDADSTTNKKRLAYYNLLKAFELGDKRSAEELEQIFPKGIPKSNQYWE